MTEKPLDARQMLTDHGIPEDVIDGILTVHAHQLAEHIRGESARGRKSGLTRIYYRDAADMIDPQAHDDPLTVLRAIEEAPGYALVPGCPHCPDGHTPPDHGQTWGAFLSPERDGDGQPMQIIVCRSAGAHVAESDAEWIRGRLNDTSEQP
jgi:hypothetical protein